MNGFTTRYAGLGSKGFRMELVKGSSVLGGKARGYLVGFGALVWQTLSPQNLKVPLT